MELAFIENQHEMRAFAFSICVVLFSVFAVIAFVFGNMLFYVFAVLAIATGFYMAYHLSKTPTGAEKAKAPRRRPRRH